MKLLLPLLLFAGWMTGIPAASACLAQAPAPAAAGLIQLDPPGQRDFVLDQANMLTPEDTAEIKELADQLLTDKAVPLVVVTINSMSDHGGAGMRIETFARLLFDQWQIGPARLGETSWNKGILLLVSRNDRQARIELGAGWGREKDDVCLKIMDQQIIPRFKEGKFSEGIKAGAISLEKMARDLQLPAPPRPAWFYPVLIGGIVIAVLSAISLIRSGASGWAWLIWGAVFAGLGFLLYHLATTQRGSGGGFSGGSFGGGGFSGGGGASGSW